MSRFYRLLLVVDRPLFLHVNLRWHHTAMNWLFQMLSLLGGATFTLCFSLAAGMFAPEPWSSAGWQALAAVAISHLPVALAKRSAPRLRPHLEFPEIHTNRRPLRDPSFPSGHTTAAFAMLTPWMHADPTLLPMLLPVAIGVALSRIYFGLHYPSDTAAGALLGSSTALLMSLCI
ncbi:phosphatase PAP2 family protein [Cohnella pontilimi]|uniref:Phosphatase PAP2 family protein n=1 Tax=Cohnella pontilimi TaxID=2564100 RepID=A0A4U0F8B0_9BACL|nr:phosphatase PAP2 family protein [Cohnella pontilimi]TJY40963.1 phosphatase PAP2 family protein [Cohnella pontilimi]